MEATWRNGYRAKVDAKIAYAELEKIRKKDGEVTADTVVASATRKNSPIHPAFTWDDAAAGNEYRKEEARRMIRAVEIVRLELPKHPARAYEVYTSPTKDKPNRKVYTTTEEILADPVSREELLGNAIRDATSYRRRYAMLTELADVFHAMDKLV